MAYTGSIVLSAGLTPMEGTNYPLAKARDVFIDDNKRLDAALEIVVERVYKTSSGDVALVEDPDEGLSNGCPVFVDGDDALYLEQVGNVLKWELDYNGNTYYSASGAEGTLPGTITLTDANDSTSSITLTYEMRSKAPEPYAANPAMAGDASPGTGIKYALGNHVHPAETRVDEVALPGECFPVKYANGVDYTSITSNDELRFKDAAMGIGMYAYDALADGGYGPLLCYFNSTTLKYWQGNATGLTFTLDGTDTLPIPKSWPVLNTNAVIVRSVQVAKESDVVERLVGKLDSSAGAPAFEVRTDQNPYQHGELVSKDGKIYQCDDASFYGEWSESSWVAQPVSKLFLGKNGNQTLNGTLTLGNTRIEEDKIVCDIGAAGESHLKFPAGADEFLAVLSDTMRFSDTVTYDVNAVVFSNGSFWQCTTKHSAGAWKDSHFTKIFDVATDVAPTANSTKLLTSGAISTALGDKVSKSGGTMTGGLTVPNLTVGRRKSNTTVGTKSTAEGYDVEASGLDSHAEGYYTTASGSDSHAEGSNTTASNDFSHAEGSWTTASGGSSHAEGSSTTASNYNAHAEGSNTTASGDTSHAEGSGTTAEGSFSHAEGIGTFAGNNNEHAQGRYNASHTGETDSKKTLSSIGFGDDGDDRKNAVETMQNGKTYIYGLGGYDGTNPTALGVKDLTAAVQDAKFYGLIGSWDGTTPPGGNTVSYYAVSSSTATLNVANSSTFTSGRVLDFIVNVQNLTSSQATINFGGLGSDWYAVVDDGEDLTDMTTLAGNEIARFCFTQMAFKKNDKPVMWIAKQVLTEVQSGGGTYQLETDGTVTTDGELNADGTFTVEGELNNDGTFTVEAI